MKVTLFNNVGEIVDRTNNLGHILHYSTFFYIVISFTPTVNYCGLKFYTYCEIST